MRFSPIPIAAACLGLLAACGGGGSSTSAITPVLTGPSTTASAAPNTASQTAPVPVATPVSSTAGVQRVILISIDGLHQQDLTNFTASNPNSALAQLAKTGVSYQSAYTPGLSDSFPGLAALVTGGSAKSHGLFYDDSYDATLYPPGSNCTGSSGTEVALAENLDVGFDPTSGNVIIPANTDGTKPFTAINPAQLPMRKVTAVSGSTCIPVYPHDYVKVNTIFEVIKQTTGSRTAWSDKHPAYDWVNGPSGKGVDDLFTPEINAESINGSGVAYQAVVATTKSYDDIKVNAILNQIDGKDSGGTLTVGVPKIFGMNFQALSVAQKSALTGGGYLDANGTPGTQIADALSHTDASLAKMVAELKVQNLFSSTLFIVTAKHGQSPIDIKKLQKVGHLQDLITAVPALASFNANIAQITDDDTALIWLVDHTQAAAFASALTANSNAIFSQSILSGAALVAKFGDPAQGRTPDIIIQPVPGVIYSKSSKKIAEHGGNSQDDSNVGLLIEYPGLLPQTVTTTVQTTQVAATILKVLGIDPNKLQAVTAEGTTVLPMLGL